MIIQPKETILEVHSVSKSFSNIQAVKNISFSLEQGDIFAFLGPNGAGKTTTLRILLDIIKADNGQIYWKLKNNLQTLPEAGQIGYLPEERGLYPDIPILRSLVYLASIRGMNPIEAKTAAMEWLEKLELADRAKDKLQSLSKGNQQKIQFIASILHKPLFAILDEPFAGLDPVNQEKFIDYIKEINKQGTTILLSAHQMSLVEKIANKVFLINTGKEIYYGSLSGIYENLGNQHIIHLSFKAAVSEVDFQHISEIENISRIDDFQLQLTFKHGINLNKALGDIATIGDIANITSHQPDLHDIFLQLVKKHLP
ncbi:MAG: ATP-binding cassette domain-containing protein [Bacteroidales bacterium]|nr:ATP-binding cassette domain-containing protein [Bacteroidales bacterium]